MTHGTLRRARAGPRGARVQPAAGWCILGRIFTFGTKRFPQRLLAAKKGGGAGLQPLERAAKVTVWEPLPRCHGEGPCPEQGRVEEVKGNKARLKYPRQTSPGMRSTHGTLRRHLCSEGAGSVPLPPVTLASTSPCSFPRALGAETRHRPPPGLPSADTCIAHGTLPPHQRLLPPQHPLPLWSTPPRGGLRSTPGEGTVAFPSPVGPSQHPLAGNPQRQPPHSCHTPGCCTRGRVNARAKILGWGRPQ